MLGHRDGLQIAQVVNSYVLGQDMYGVLSRPSVRFITPYKIYLKDITKHDNMYNSVS